MLYNTTPDQLYEPRAAVDPLGYGRVAIVTGCASGIGLACTQLLLAHQFCVCGLDRRPFDYAKLLRVVDHGRFHFHQCDLTVPGACDDAVRICQHSFGGGGSLDAHIDVLVNVAGVMDGFASADTVTDAVWDEVLAVNLTVPVRMMRAVLSSMVASSPSSSSSASPGGVIINVSSTAGLSGAVAGIAYTASKHGLVGFSLSGLFLTSSLSSPLSLPLSLLSSPLSPPLSLLPSLTSLSPPDRRHKKRRVALPP